MSEYLIQKKEILDGDYVICSCEGAAEETIINLLLKNNMLIFDTNNLVDGEITRIRKAKRIEEQFLKRSYKKKIHIIRILDSKNEKFNLSKIYKLKPNMIDSDIISIITHPEIEILLIISENKYDDFQKYKNEESPSKYCNRLFKSKIDVKSKEFLEYYFDNIYKLLNAIYLYKSKVNIEKNELCLYDLLKDEYKKLINK